MVDLVEGMFLLFYFLFYTGRSSLGRITCCTHLKSFERRMKFTSDGLYDFIDEIVYEFSKLSSNLYDRLFLSSLQVYDCGNFLRFSVNYLEFLFLS